jgi:hypothetical protein
MLTHRTWPGIVMLPVTVLAVLVVAGCGSVGSDSDSAASSAPGSGSPGTPSPGRPVESTPTPTEQLPTGESSETAVTVRGTVVAGVEAGCLLLGDYLLIISDPADKQVLQPGASVEVTGRPKSGMMTICQQGMPLIVSSARAL